MHCLITDPFDLKKKSSLGNLKLNLMKLRSKCQNFKGHWKVWAGWDGGEAVSTTYDPII